MATVNNKDYKHCLKKLDDNCVRLASDLVRNDFKEDAFTNGEYTVIIFTKAIGSFPDSYEHKILMWSVLDDRGASQHIQSTYNRYYKSRQIKRFTYDEVDEFAKVLVAEKL